MDPLEHMLTDPLDPKEEDGGQITEECMLGNCKVDLPEDLLEDPDIFFSVLSEGTWNDVLTDSQRQHLRQFLPQFPNNNTEEQESTIRDLFNNTNFHFGNPLHLAQRLFRDGYFNPEVVKYRQLCAKSQRRRQLHSLQQYYHRLLKQILVSRKELLDFAVQNGLDFPPKRRLPNKTQAEMRDLRVRRRLNRILKEVKAECEDSNASSDEDDISLWNATPPSPSSPTATVSLRVLPSLSTPDMKVTDKAELGELDLKVMLHHHREKRKRQPDHPDLVTSDIHLGDILSRANIGRKGPLPLFDLPLPKKKMRDERKKKKLKAIKIESEDPCEILTPSDSCSAPPVNIINSLPDTPSTPLTNIKEEIVEEAQSSPVALEEITASFFSLLENIFRSEGPASTLMLEDKVQTWQSSPASSLNAWFSSASCWSDLVLQALQFLAGETKDGMMALPSGFSPFVEFVEEFQQWRWIGPTQDTEKDLSALCQLWLDSKDFVVKTENEDMLEFTSSTPKLSTDYVVRPSTGDEKQVFQVQEQQRYNQPHKAFTFRMHGFESVVGPVKGVFDKEMSLNKAREHTLLRSDRPPYVTILSLVRDAAARLPNGEGTRAEICELLKDSQFLAPDVTSAQVNTVVSGALDRLHYEKDPCVKYDIGRKLWIYLHRHRSQEEFERIHQAQAAAAKARKAQQQKPKPASKPKTGSKDGGSKTPGSLDAGLDLACNSMSPVPSTPTPNTPGTPKSPLPLSATTPTKAGVPDTMKSSPGVLLVSPPSLPQLGTILPTSQACPPASQPVTSQQAARIVSHLAASSLPQVRVVSAQPGLGPPAVTQQATLVHQTTHQIRMPVSVAAKSLSQAVVSVPLRSPSCTSPVQVPTTLSVSTLTVTKPQTGSPGSPANNPTSPAVLQGVTSPNIKQVSITGQLGMKTAGGAGIPITATNLRIQGKDVLRLPPSSITTDAKGQTVLRITPDMMATLAKSPVATVKLTSDFLGGAAAGSKSISATLHVAPSHPSPSTASGTPPSAAEALTAKSSPVASALLKAGGDTAIRLMPTLAVSVADQKPRTFSTVASPDKSGATIRIMPGLGVIPQKQGQTITMTTASGSKPLTASTCANIVTMAASVVAGAKGITVAPGASASPLSLGAATATVRQVPASVVTTQTGKLPARITVPLSVLNQPLKSKSVVTTPLVKGNLNTNISSLGRNIILTTMPAGTKLIAGNKPVSFVTAQQFQQLQQQGQATQVRIQTVPAQQIQHHVAATSPKSVSTVVVTTAPSPKCAPDPPPAPQQ
ncbi:PREDICTED: nuclear factor related to kappa-B-binding protein isoform X2 [Cyprinodon variegatus]|uniref:Nuclear factor related to kappa-B-binding protein n=1 Tax=Cyprinodon variegatus TaxID=28743 RepID=A0A3Q2D084_CYPVA|nr:PREDICTED: nuclear factor related to kappa-B-binding protein isoform X2 [Cyprinodon variegatus]